MEDKVLYDVVKVLIDNKGEDVVYVDVEKINPLCQYYVICSVSSNRQALALARHRHSLPTGDFQRIQHQQLLVEATLNKTKTIRNIDQLYEVLESVSNNIETNIDTEEILNLYNVGKKMLFDTNSTLNIEKAYLTGYDLTMYIPGLGNVYTFHHYEESLKEITQAMKINLELEKSKPIKTFNFSINNIYEVPIIGKKYYTVERNEALPNFVNSSIQYLQEWASSRNIEINIDYITEDMENYDKDKNNLIIEQDIKNGTLVSTIKTIKVKVIKAPEDIEENPTNKNENYDLNTENNVAEENNNTENVLDNTIDDIINLE